MQVHGLEKNYKRAYGQVGFWKHQSTIDNLTIIWVLMEESRLRGKGMYCCSIDFNKAFDMVDAPWGHLEKLKITM